MTSFFSRLLSQKPREPTTRAEMDDALKRLVVPELRKLGFRGRKPHFRRQRADYWELLSFQFSQFGGKFVVELGRFPLDGVHHSWGKLVPPRRSRIATSVTASGSARLSFSMTIGLYSKMPRPTMWPAMFSAASLIGECGNG